MKNEREYILFIEDMLNSMDKIFKYTEGYNFSALLGDDRTLDAVLKNFEVIGEAANNVPKEIKERYQDVPWKQMYGLRNYVSHEYFGLDLTILWRIIEKDLPANKIQIQTILAELKK